MFSWFPVFGFVQDVFSKETEHFAGIQGNGALGKDL
jgi:hypothetical protein